MYIAISNKAFVLAKRPTKIVGNGKHIIPRNSGRKSRDWFRPITKEPKGIRMGVTVLTQERIANNFFLKKYNAAILKLLGRLPSEQALVVMGCGGFKADMGLYEQQNGQWNMVAAVSANIGRGGMGKTLEGDGKSPSGIFSLGIAFGLVPAPEGTRYPYACLTPEDYWVDDSRSADYNKWVHYHDGNPKDWQSAEWLYQEKISYRHAVVINYNAAREPGKGSAIFLHVWKSEEQPTAGCTAVSEENLERILQWLDPRRAPFIIQGTPEDIIALAKGK
jgi:L,D-peptidoglycan transpeptidase YkuD (ErfK/YbiS/YcfS/YnhG family)